MLFIKQEFQSDRKNNMLLFAELVRRHRPIVERLLSRLGRGAIGRSSWFGAAQKIPKDRARVDS